MQHNHISFIHHRRYAILGVDSVVKQSMSFSIFLNSEFSYVVITCYGYYQEHGALTSEFKQGARSGTVG